jgi:hypothetical protein
MHSLIQRGVTMKTRITVFVLVLSVFMFSTAVSSSFAENPKKILYIGDSHTVGAFGTEFSKELACAFCGQVSRYGVSSSAMVHWLAASWPGGFKQGFIQSKVGTDGKEVILRSPTKKDEPVPADFPHYNQLLVGELEAVVIALGTNDVMSYCSKTPEVQAETMKGLKRMIETVKKHAKSCIWVGPTLFKKVGKNEKAGVIENGCKGNEDLYKKAIDMLRAEVVNSCCIYIDSREFKMPSDGTSEAACQPDPLKSCCSGTEPIYPNIKDNVHFDKNLGTYWARCAGLVVKEALDKAKIKPLTKPDGTPCPGTPSNNPAQASQ